MARLRFDVLHVIKLLMSGNASYHLYYMVIIVQFYLLFPLMLTAARRSHRFRQGLIPTGIGIQAASYCFHHWVFPLPEYASLFLSYTALFAFGAFMGIHYAAIVAWAIRYKRWIWSLMLLSRRRFCGDAIASCNTGLLSIENTWFELALLAYCMTIPLVLHPVGRKQLESGSRFGTSLSALGGASFGIYLVHPALLTLWDRIAPVQEQLWLYDLHTVASILIGLLGSWLLVRLCTRAHEEKVPLN